MNVLSSVSVRIFVSSSAEELYSKRHCTAAKPVLLAMSTFTVNVSPTFSAPSGELSVTVGVSASATVEHSPKISAAQSNSCKSFFVRFIDLAP